MATVSNDVAPINSGGPFPVELRLRSVVTGVTVRVNVIDDGVGRFLVTRNGVTMLRFVLSQTEVGILNLPAASQINNALATEAEGVLAPEFSALETTLAMLEIMNKVAHSMVGNESVFIVVHESVRPVYRTAPGVTIPLAVVGIIESASRRGFFEEYGYRVPDSMPEDERGGIKLSDVATTRSSQVFVFLEGALLSSPALPFLRAHLKKREIIPMCFNLFKTIYGVSPPAIEFVKEIEAYPDSDESESDVGSVGGSVIGGGDHNVGYYVLAMPAFDGTETAPIRKRLQDRKKKPHTSQYYGPKAEETQFVLLAKEGPELDPTGLRSAKATAQVQDWIQTHVVLEPEFIETDIVTTQLMLDPMHSNRRTLWWPALGVYNGGTHLRRVWAGESEVQAEYTFIDKTELVPIGCTCRDWIFRYTEGLSCCKHMYAWKLYSDQTV